MFKHIRLLCFGCIQTHTHRVRCEIFDTCVWQCIKWEWANQQKSTGSVDIVVCSSKTLYINGKLSHRFHSAENSLILSLPYWLSIHSISFCLHSFHRKRFTIQNNPLVCCRRNALFRASFAHLTVCHIWFFECESESNKMLHDAWKSAKMLVCSARVRCVCVCVSFNVRSNAIKLVTMIQPFALWLLFVQKALHLINILARCFFVSDTNLHLPLNGIARSLSHWIDLFRGKAKTHGEYVISIKLTANSTCWFNVSPFFPSHPLYFQQIGYLDVVIPPDFIAEDTSSDVIVPEGSSVKLTCRYLNVFFLVAYFFPFILVYCFHHKTFTASKSCCQRCFKCDIFLEFYFGIIFWTRNWFFWVKILIAQINLKILFFNMINLHNFFIFRFFLQSQRLSSSKCKCHKFYCDLNTFPSIHSFFNFL